MTEEAMTTKIIASYNNGTILSAVSRRERAAERRRWVRENDDVIGVAVLSIFLGIYFLVLGVM
jgi:hypothetical protein